MANLELLEKDNWDLRWNRIKIPDEVTKDAQSTTTKELIKIFDKTLPKKEGIKILEIGAAPGRWLVYFKKYFNYDIHAIDYSDIGCRKMQENFDSLNIKGKIYKMDIIKDSLSNIPRFDIVYSLGFIEHFKDFFLIIEKHIELLKNNGILILGVPNFSGFTKIILKKTSPNIYKTHNIDTMNLKNWEIFEERFKLEPLFKGYIGGLNLVHCKRWENKTIINRTIRLLFKIMLNLTKRVKYLQNLNSKYWSPYLIGIYRRR